MLLWCGLLLASDFNPALCWFEPATSVTLKSALS
jgi:hypothetical protein